MASASTADLLLSKLNIHVSGASGPKREEPIECFRPIHQAYHSALRTVDSSVAKDGVAVVYDRDIVTTWRLPSSMSAYEVFF